MMESVSRGDKDMDSSWSDGVSVVFATRGGAFGRMSRFAVPFRLDDES